MNKENEFSINGVKSNVLLKQDLLNIDSIVNGGFKALINSNLEFALHYLHFANILCEIITTKGQPKMYSNRYINSLLLQYGKFAIIKDGEEILIKPFLMTSKNVYSKTGEPLEIVAYDYNPLSYTTSGNGVTYKNSDNEKQFVIVRANAYELPLACYIYYFVKKIVNIEQDIDTNLFVNQMPLLVNATEDERLSVVNIFTKFREKVKAIFISKHAGQDFKNFEVIDTHAEFLVDKLLDVKDRYYLKFFEFLGINHTPYEKKERLTDDEVHSNDMLIELVQSAFYNSIKESYDKANELFGTDLKLEWNINGFITDKDFYKGGESDDNNPDFSYSE